MKQSPRDGSGLKIGHIDHGQVGALAAFLLGVKALLITPTLLTVGLASGAAIVVAISLGLGYVALLGWLKWAKETEKLDFVPAVIASLGPVLGTIASTYGMLSLLFGVSLTVRLFAGGAAISLVPAFPTEALLVILIGSSAYAAWLGLESVARSATFFLAPTFLSFLVVVFTSARDIDLRNLLPIMGPGPKEVLLAGFAHVGLWGSVSAVIVLKSYVRTQDDLRRGATRGLFVAGFGLFVAVTVILLFFPYPACTRLTHPMGILARSVYLGRFLQRIEAVFVFSWFFASAVQTSFIFLVCLIMVAQMSKTKTYRPFMPALITTSFGLAALPESAFVAAQSLSTWYYESSAILMAALGWILYFAAKIRLRGSERVQPDDEEQ